MTARTEHHTPQSFSSIFKPPSGIDTEGKKINNNNNNNNNNQEDIYRAVIMTTTSLQEFQFM